MPDSSAPLTAPLLMRLPSPLLPALRTPTGECQSLVNEAISGSSSDRPGEPPLPFAAVDAHHALRTWAGCMAAPQAPDREALKPTRRRAGIATAGSAALGAVLVLGLMAIALVTTMSVEDGSPPAPRKSAAVALLLHDTQKGTAVDAQLLVWSGMGHKQMVFADMRSFSLASGRWQLLHPRTAEASASSSSSSSPDGHGGWGRGAVSRPHKGSPGGGGEGPKAANVPLARWKAGVVQGRDGMLVMSGDSPLEHKDVYDHDTWLLRLPSLEWQRADNSSDARADAGTSAHGPCARRAHSAALFTSSDGSTRVAIYGGRKHDGTLLGDVWVGTLHWPHVRWERLFHPLAHAAATEDGAKGPKANYPTPRKGHIGVVADNGTGPKLLVHGGRNDTDYLGRLWSFDLEGSKRWTDITPALGPFPAPCDHHAAVVSGDRLFIYGGRSGPTYATSVPLSDVWSLHLPSLTWQLEAQHGPAPLPRFLASSLLYHPPNVSSDQLLVFGGETGLECKLNDVWSLDLSTITWRQLSPAQWARKRCMHSFG